MKYFSAFAGIGGFELGIKLAVPGAECVGFSEIDEKSIEVYNKHFPDHKNYGNIKKIDPKSLPDFDCFVGGFPCQAFSIAGKKQGFRDPRGTLFFECYKIIKHKRPRYFVLENVKGLLFHDEGFTFKTIISKLDELGYIVQWKLYNSEDYGVAQHRERVFIIGFLGEISSGKILPI